MTRVPHAKAPPSDPGLLLPAADPNFETVHRFWLNAAHTNHRSLPDMAVKSLNSFSPEYRQLVWVFGTLDDYEPVANTFLRDASVVMSRELLTELLTLGATAEAVCDVFKVMVLAKFGGWAIDFDVLWLGKPLGDGILSQGPRYDSLYLHAEPERANAVPFSHHGPLVKGGGDCRATYNIGIMHGRCEDVWTRCKEALLTQWRARTTKRKRGARDKEPHCLFGTKVIWGVLEKHCKNLRSEGRDGRQCPRLGGVGKGRATVSRDGRVTVSPVTWSPVGLEGGGTDGQACVAGGRMPPATLDTELDSGTSEGKEQQRALSLEPYLGWFSALSFGDRVPGEVETVSQVS